jgi:hypothetical protein
MLDSDVEDQSVIDGSDIDIDYDLISCYKNNRFRLCNPLNPFNFVKYIPVVCCLSICVISTCVVIFYTQIQMPPLIHSITTNTTILNNTDDYILHS